MSFWIYFAIVVGLIALCFCNIAVRVISAPRGNPKMVWINVLLIIILFFSLPQTAGIVDEATGGIGLANAISHVFLATTGYLMAHSLFGKTRMTDTRLGALARSPWVLAICAVGVVVCWALNVGVAGETRTVFDSLYSPFYWLFSGGTFIASLPVAFQTTRRIAARNDHVGAFEAHLRIYKYTAITYTLITIGLGMYFVTAVWPEVYVAREVIVYLSLLMLIGICFAAPLSCPVKAQRRAV